MKKLKFKLPIYDTEITVIQLELGDTYKQVRNSLPKHLSEECFEDIKDCVEHYEDNWDGGWTMNNKSLNSAIIMFTGFSSAAKRANVVAHEKRHLEDRILSRARIEDTEAAAYLAGYLEEKLMWIKNLSTNILDSKIIRYGNTSKKNS